MRFKAVIFDMDGTLIDNYAHWEQVDRLFLQKYNVEHNREYTSLVNGRAMRESVELLRKHYNLDHPLEEMLAEKIKMTDVIYEQAKPMPGAEMLLKTLKKITSKTAIASGSSLNRIEMMVNRLAWQQYFDVLASVDHVGQIGKPDPAIYQYAVRQLGLDPAECVVIEDARNGLLSAKAAGLTCIVVCHDQREDFSGADRFFTSLEDPALYSYLNVQAL